jgi:hypothetical protein
MRFSNSGQRSLRFTLPEVRAPLHWVNSPRNFELPQDHWDTATIYIEPTFVGSIHDTVWIHTNALKEGDSTKFVVKATLAELSVEADEAGGDHDPIFYHPATRTVTTSRAVQLYVYDLRGVQLIERDIGQGNSISLNQLGTGSYFVLAVDGANQYRTRVNVSR